ncbi:MAG: HAD hydrolase family protein [Actinomycetales bacterium]|nr:HAD hydrolase family protein [Actinomycetales bacterium]
MAAPRAVFLDIDGTYAHRTVVPDAHVAAVRAARAAGNPVLLCTGRPRAMVPERIMAAGFDGFIGGAGAYVEVGGQVLADVRFPAEVAARAVEVLAAHDVAFILEAPDALYGPLDVARRLAERFAKRFPDLPAQGPRDILDPLRMAADLSGASFGKITCFDSAVPIPALAEEIGPEVAALPSSIPGMGDSAGEIHLVGLHKAVGMRMAAAHLGVPMDRVVAVGDGLNDVEMLAAAGTGVAVAGADPQLLAVADRIAPGPDSGGLAVLFAELGLGQR